MPVTVKREFVLTDNDGKTLVFSQKEVESLKSDTTITITCSGPRCQARNARPEPFTLSWNEEKLAQDPLSLADEFFKVLKLSVNTSPVTELIFCGPSCLRDYLTYTYMPPLSPREQNERAKQEQAKQLAELNPHLKSPAVEFHTKQKPPVTLPVHSGSVLRVVPSDEESTVTVQPSEADLDADAR